MTPSQLRSTSVPTLRETAFQIKLIKDTFERALAKELNLTRVSAPLFLESASGLNDDLSGVERPVEFALGDTGTACQIVQSLAKWKRMTLWRYGFEPYEGLYTDMNAIRRDEVLGPLHSIYVDQWDWERIILSKDRNIDTLKSTVRSIYRALRFTESALGGESILPEEITFMTSQELEDKFPHLCAKDREHAQLRECGSLFLIGIGHRLQSGNPHDGRASDYDDWTLNGDILVFHEPGQCALELSSMGIRVDRDALLRQEELKGNPHDLSLHYYQGILNDEFPLTIGGGIGQSRMCMYFLKKRHIGEVQSSYWPQDMRDECREQGIILL
ncbi:MAG: aspartate--ammonia ligase [Tissierellia bacterium]|nr:aspartate--ammonia ligase [Bacillota bacterium]NLL22764.1 aspartate--ammonia ligase [Tissierellia bacterium]